MALGAAAPRTRRTSITRDGSCCARSCSISTCSGRRRSVARGARAGARRGALRRPAVHGRWRQRRRVGAAGPVPSRRLESARRRTRSAPRARTGGCRSIAGTSSPPSISGGCTSARGAAPICTTGIRVDHLVGFFRTFAWPKDGSEPFFTPADEPTQIALGERLLSIFREAGATIIAEDLGTVPDFVRASLARLSVPGFRVFGGSGTGMRGSAVPRSVRIPRVSVATSGTHDTESMAVWWDSTRRRGTRADRRAADRAAHRGRRRCWRRPFNPTVRDALLETLFASGSNLLLLPMIDAFGWTDRINEPATISDRNWTFRLPWPIDRMNEIPAACERQASPRSWTGEHGRI